MTTGINAIDVGDLIKNSLTAQWEDAYNNLSGQDSSCLPIELKLELIQGFTVCR